MFLTALQAKLKGAGGVLESLNEVAVQESSIKNLDEIPEANPGGGDKKTAVFLWDIIGGSVAAIILFLLIVHFRYSYWQTHQPVSTEPVITSGSRRAHKPSTRSYERVQDNEFDTSNSSSREEEGVELGENLSPTKPATATVVGDENRV